MLNAHSSVYLILIININENLIVYNFQNTCSRKHMKWMKWKSSFLFNIATHNLFQLFNDDTPDYGLIKQNNNSSQTINTPSGGGGEGGGGT